MSPRSVPWRSAMQGIRLREVRIIGDDTDTIVATMNEMRGRYDYLFTTGGVVRHDDITVGESRRALGVGVVVHLMRGPYWRPIMSRGGLTEARLHGARAGRRGPHPQQLFGRAGHRIHNLFLMAGVRTSPPACWTR